jgi:hypothetical protein
MRPLSRRIQSHTRPRLKLFGERQRPTGVPQAGPHSNPQIPDIFFPVGIVPTVVDEN